MYRDHNLCCKPPLLERRGGAHYSTLAVSLVTAIANDTRRFTSWTAETMEHYPIFRTMRQWKSLPPLTVREHTRLLRDIYL
jgi:hypothetical protein